MAGKTWAGSRNGERSTKMAPPVNEDDDEFGALQVAQPHLAELLKTGIWWQTILRQLLNGFSKQDLATACHAEQTSQAIERSGQIVSPARFCLAGVDRHTRAQRSQLIAPWLCQNRALGHQGCAESSRCRGKGGLRTIPDRLEKNSAVRGDDLPQQ